MKPKELDGMPDTTQANLKNKKILIVMVLTAILILAAIFLLKKTNAKEIKPVEETYTIQMKNTNLNHNEIKKINPNLSTANNANLLPDQEMIKKEIELIQEKQRALQQRLAAPLMLVNANQFSVTNEAKSTQAMVSNVNTQFMNQTSNQKIETVDVNQIGSLTTIIAQGSLIHATLESATNSDLPGVLRATVSEPMYSEDGAQVLIPVGSRLTGQYKSGMIQGQSRIFIVWTRLLTPNGVSIQLGSMGVDSLGVAGIGADEINRHFWERFGTASLLSLLCVATDSLGNNEENNNSYKQALASSFMQAASESVNQDNRIAPTLKTYQGKPIIVFVAKDIHFESVNRAMNSKIKIF